MLVAGVSSLASARFSDVVAALDHLPGESVVDGELVALAEDGKPSFNLLHKFSLLPESQNHPYGCRRRSVLLDVDAEIDRAGSTPQIIGTSPVLGVHGPRLRAIP